MIKKKVAVFEYIEGCMSGYRVTYDFDPKNDMVRVSEWVEIDFPERDNSEILPELVKGIDAEIESIKEKAMQEVSKLQTKKAELLALRHCEQ